MTPAATHRFDRPTRRLVGVVAAAESLVFIDGLMVAVALPVIAAELHFDPASLQWVLNAYTVLLGGTLLVAGRAADVFGRRRVLVAGLLLFAAAAFAAGLAPTPALLLVARGVQGAGAGAVQSAALAVTVAATRPGGQRERALAVLAVVAGAATVGGVLAGGAVTATIGWRWLLLCSAPAAVAVGWLALRWLHPSRSQERSAVDWLGAAAATTAVVLTVAALVRLHDAPPAGWWAGVAVAWTASAAVFVWRQRHAPAPLVPPSSLRGRWPATAAGALLPVGLGAALFLSPLHLQQQMGQSAFQTGLWLLPLAAGVAMGGPVARRITARLGVRSAATVGFLLQALGLLHLGLAIGGDSLVAWAGPGLALVGAGAPAAYVPVTTAATAAADAEAGAVSGVFNTAQQLGNALALAVIAVVATGGVRSAYLVGTVMVGAALVPTGMLREGHGYDPRP